MPIGYLVTTALMGLCTAFALAPPRPRRSSPSNKSYWLGFLLNELPFLGFYWLLASTLLAVGQGDIVSPVGWLALGVAVIASAGLGVVAWRGLQARQAVDQALEESLGTGWRRSPSRYRAAACPGAGSCSRRSSCDGATSSASRTSATAMPGG